MSDVVLILFAIILACTDVIFIYEIFYSLDRRLKKLEERRRIRGNPLGEGYYEEPPTYDAIALQVCKKLLSYLEKKFLFNFNFAIVIPKKNEKTRGRGWSNNDYPFHTIFFFVVFLKKIVIVIFGHSIYCSFLCLQVIDSNYSNRPTRV